MSNPLAAIRFGDGSLYPIDTLKFTTSIVKSIAELQPHLPEEKRNCGVFACIIMQRDDVHFPPVFWGMIGLVPDHKVPIYHGFSREKVDRTLINPGHVLSWQSMDDAAEHYQGAAVARFSPRLNIGVGISGLPSAADEAIATRSLLNAGWIDRVQADAYAIVSNNPYWQHLR